MDDNLYFEYTEDFINQECGLWLPTVASFQKRSHFLFTGKPVGMS